jgi:hypothetical protein
MKDFSGVFWGLYDRLVWKCNYFQKWLKYICDDSDRTNKIDFSLLFPGQTTGYALMSLAAA